MIKFKMRAGSVVTIYYNSKCQQQRLHHTLCETLKDPTT